ncbi:lipocalin-like domain-containing protein, partial [Streptomyces sp900105245]|uniref:lipocalin-like domain-containing protein n=1 Tax=Streptomyces sp. 900105245 TaxID=3154379 RepID=UPI0033168031
MRADDLVGVWHLVSFRELDGAGTPGVGPLGDAPRGRLVYTRDGHVSVHMMRGPDPGPVPYMGYAGTWRLDGSRIVHRIEVTPPARLDRHRTDPGGDAGRGPSDAPRPHPRRRGGAPQGPRLAQGPRLVVLCWVLDCLPMLRGPGSPPPCACPPGRRRRRRDPDTGKDRRTKRP